MAKGRGSRKGSAYEREIAKLLSKWWTYGERSDIFWRSSSRARMSKANSNQKELGQFGDIEAIDPIGYDLMNTVTIEIKRGYNKEAACNCMDRPMRKGKYSPTAWLKFIEQAKTDSRNAGVPHWLLIFKRDSRRAMIYMELELAANLTGLRDAQSVIVLKLGDAEYLGVPLDDFFSLVDPREMVHCQIMGILRA